VLRGNIAHRDPDRSSAPARFRGPPSESTGLAGKGFAAMTAPPRLAPALWVVLGLLAVIRLAALLMVITPGEPLTGDEPIYDRVAHNLLEGKGYTYNDAPWVWKPPGWPLTLAAIYAVGGDNRRAVGAFQGLCDTGTALIGAWVAWQIFQTSFAALAAFVMLLFWPPFFSESRFMQTEPLFTFMVMGCVATWVTFVKRPRARTAFLLGALTALAALVRPTGLVPVAGLLIGWALIERSAARRARWHIWAGALGLVVVLMPWTIRNAVVFHAFVPISTGGGEHFFMGSTPETQGRWDPAKWDVLRDRVIEREEKRLGYPLDPLRLDRAMLRAGLDNWRKDPSGSAVLTLKRFWRLVLVPVESDDRPWLRISFLIVLLGIYALALMAGFGGGPENADTRRMARIFLIALAINAGVGSIVYARSRYFQPVRPLAMILAAGVIATRVEKRVRFPAPRLDEA
jgi:4-amino-4-deoxy-L-arabinose transferase-like glycosyltransferase